MRKIIFILGTAGSGKTTLSLALRDYLEDGILINLDPANINSKSDLDIRDFVRTEDIMKKYNLGPNGAILKSMEIAKEYIDKILKKIPEDKYYILVDTPGQLEIFLYKDFGKEIVSKFNSLGESLGLFLIDIEDALKPENLLSILAWDIIIYLRLRIRTLAVINKKDKVNTKTIEKIKEKLRKKEIIKELQKREDNLSYLIAQSFEEFYEYSSLYKRPIFISSTKRENIKEVISAIFDLICTCGDIS